MLTALFLLCGLLAVQAQIPAEVSEMMRKCEANMNHASGCEYDMNVHMSMMVMSIDMKMVITQKNGKSLVRTSMSKMGREMTTENGFDGHQSWSFKHVKLTDMVKVIPGKKVHVRFSEPCAVQIDGETILDVTEYWAEA
jgi:uncharacterized protein YabE (DUF348 family)